MAAAVIFKNQKIDRDWSYLVEIWHSQAVQPSWSVRR